MNLPRLRWTRALPVGLAALLAGCASFDTLPPPQAKLDAATLGARNTVTQWPADDWWKRYGDEQLDSLIRATGLRLSSDDIRALDAASMPSNARS